MVPGQPPEVAAELESFVKAPYPQCPTVPSSGAICPVLASKGKTCPWAEGLFGGQFLPETLPDGLSCGEAPELKDLKLKERLKFKFPDYIGQMSDLKDTLIKMGQGAVYDVYAEGYKIWMDGKISVGKVKELLDKVCDALELPKIPDGGDDPQKDAKTTLAKIGSAIRDKAVEEYNKVIDSIPQTIDLSPPDIPTIPPGTKIPIPSLGSGTFPDPDGINSLAGKGCPAGGRAAANKVLAATKGTPLSS